MERLLRRARRADPSPTRIQELPKPTEPAVPAAELTCLAVVNGCDLWVSAEGPVPQTARLALVHRRRKEVRLLPEPTAEDLTGQDLPPGSVVAACRLVGLLAEQDTGTWDLALVTRGAEPRLLHLGTRAQLYPTGPAGPIAGPGGLVVTPYRTKDGRGAVGVSVAPPSVEVVALANEPGGLSMTLELHRWSGPTPTSLVLDQRRGPGRLTLPLEIAGGRASVTVPVHLLAGQLGVEPASVWDVAAGSPAGRTACGRTARDVSEPRRVYRYAAQRHEGSGDGGGRSPVVVVRPYFTNDRTLAVEVNGMSHVPADS